MFNSSAWWEQIMLTFEWRGLPQWHILHLSFSWHKKWQLKKYMLTIVEFQGSGRTKLGVQKISDLLSMQQSSQRGPVSILTLLPQNKWPYTKRGIQGNVMQSFSLSPAQSHSKIHRQPRWLPWSTPQPPIQCHALPASPEFTCRLQKVLRKILVNKLAK